MLHKFNGARTIFQRPKTMVLDESEAVAVILVLDGHPINEERRKELAAKLRRRLR